jgi:hypothetical protein
LPGLATLAGPQGTLLQQPLTRIHALVAQALLNYAPDHPEKTASLLAEIYRRTAKLLDDAKASSLEPEQKASVTRELEIKLQQVNDALALALGLEMAALVTPGGGPSGLDVYSGTRSALPTTPQETSSQVTPGSDIRVRVHIARPSGVAVRSIALTTPVNEHWTVVREGAPGLDDKNSTSGDAIFRVTVDQNATPTAPYFSRPSPEQPYYDINDPQYRNLSFAPYPVTGIVMFDYDGIPVRLSQAVQTMHQELGLGAVFAPLVVTPGLSVSLGQPWMVVPISDQGGAQHDVTIAARVHATHDAAGVMRLQLPDGWQATPSTAEFHLHAGEDASLPFQVKATALAATSYPITAAAESGNHRFTVGYETAGYPGLIPYNLYRPAATNVRGLDVRAADCHVGYVMGTCSLPLTCSAVTSRTTKPSCWAFAHMLLAPSCRWPMAGCSPGYTRAALWWSPIRALSSITVTLPTQCT